jgi:hypothetical protein
MLDADEFRPDRWEIPDGAPEAMPPGRKQKSLPRSKKTVRFLKGPIPWPWLLKAMQLPGKALAVGLMLWKEAGCARRRTIHFCVTRAVAEGIPITTARRAIHALEQAGLVAIHRRPGRGLEVTLLDE